MRHLEAHIGEFEQVGISSVNSLAFRVDAADMGDAHYQIDIAYDFAKLARICSCTTPVNRVRAVSGDRAVILIGKSVRMAFFAAQLLIAHDDLAHTGGCQVFTYKFLLALLHSDC